MNSLPNNTHEILLQNGKLKPNLLAAIKAVLSAEVYLQTIAPIHESLCQAAMNKHKPVIDDTRLHHRLDPAQVGKPITEFKDLYMATDETAAAIYADVKLGMTEHGLVTDNPDCCAFLVAENVVREAKRNLIDAMSPYTGIKSDQIFNMERRAKLVELSKNLLVSLACSTGEELNDYKLATPVK
jgi:hypothetical protein